MKKIVAWGSVLVLMLSCTYVFAQPRVRRVKIPQSLTRVKRIPKNALKGELRYVPRRTAQATSKATQAAAAQSGKTTGAVSKSTRVTKGAKSTLANQVERQVTQAEQTQAPRLTEIPTRVQIAEIYKQAKERSKQEGDPNILIGKESDISFMRYKRGQETERLRTQVEQLRAKDQSALSQEISKYYDDLIDGEMKRHSDAEKDILKRRLEQGNVNAQYEHEPEMNRHLDAMDRINEAEIAAREEVAKNPGLSSVSLKEREARIVKESQYLEDEKLELDWQKEMLEKKNAELIQRRKQFEEEEKGIVARINAARDLRVNDVFEQGRVQRDYELLREKQSQLAAEFEQYQNEVESFNQSVEQYNTAVEQLNADWENFSIDRKILLKNPSEKSVEVIQSKKPL